MDIFVIIRSIYDWQEKNYQCAICGTHESVKYWVISNDGWFPACNKCALAIPEGTMRVLRSEE